MKPIGAIAVLLIFLASCSQQRYTIVKGVDVFDGEKVRENVDFVFTESRIIRISPQSKRYRHARVIDGKGKTILPPMVNAHVHVRNADNLKEAQSAGIFALLDMFSTDSRANGLRPYKDSLSCAQYYSSNVGATPPGGHGTQFGVAIPTIGDTLSPSQFVRDRVAQNADYIKITHEASMERLDSMQLKELILTAHQLDRIAVAHISDLQNALEVVRQDVDGLAHLWYTSGSTAGEKDLDLLRDKGVFVVPTLSVVARVIDKAETKGLEGNYLSMEDLKNEVRKLNEHGISILAGTDSPNFRMNYSTQLFEELILLVECGMTEIEALQSATVNVYSQFHLGEFSVLSVHGKPSFILVGGKPHLRIEDLQNEKRIWKNGIEIG